MDRKNDEAVGVFVGEKTLAMQLGNLGVVPHNTLIDDHRRHWVRLGPTTPKAAKAAVAAGHELWISDAYDMWPPRLVPSEHAHELFQLLAGRWIDTGNESSWSDPTATEDCELSEWRARHDKRPPKGARRVGAILIETGLG